MLRVFALLSFLLAAASAQLPPVGEAAPLHMVAPRKAAPDFSANAVVDDKFARVSMSDYAGKWLVIAFFPAAWTFSCPTELVALSEAMPRFRELNAEVIGVSTDSHHTLLAWSRTPRSNGGVGKLDIPLVADIAKDISRSYGVLVTDKDDEMYGAALRGLFIVDPTGKIRSLVINDDQVGRNVDEVARTIEAFQYAEEHGEVCPANWRPGQATIVPTPDGSRPFFEVWGQDHPESS